MKAVGEEEAKLWGKYFCATGRF